MSNKLYSPVSNQAFIWLAEYLDGTLLSEYTYQTKTPNSFNKIDKNKLLRFGLVGCGMKFYFDIATGVFYLGGRTIEVFLKIDGKEYYLTGNKFSLYNDIIQFKDAYTSFNPYGQEQLIGSEITQFNFGYKIKLNIDNLCFNFKPIVKIPYEQPAYIEFNLVSDKEINGTFCIKRNGIIVDEFPTILEANNTKKLNWIIR